MTPEIDGEPRRQRRAFSIRRWGAGGGLVVLVLVLAAVLWLDDEGPDGLDGDAAGAGLSGVPEAFTPERADFAVEVKDAVIPYRLLGLFVMPGEEVEIEPVLTGGSRTYEVTAESGDLASEGDGRWMWTAPQEAGMYVLEVMEEETEESITLNAFVKVPFDHQQEVLNGYQIGRYEQEPLKGDPVYNPPEGFVEVTPENRDVRVSPHFTLGQFLCKQESEFPKYLLLDERLLMKLEMILQEINDSGIEANTLHVMSGYRTPYYNKTIGNRTKYSRHLYGGAADIFVDMNNDENMDDLTGDGEVTRADAEAMAELVEAQMDEIWYRPFIGGLGIYSPAAHRGPFIHVDVRGEPARW